MIEPRAFFIKNHSASELHSAPVATLPSISTRPAFATKDLFVKWCHDSTTEHVFYTLTEPENPGIRSSGKNPIKYLHGIVADYDGEANAIQAALLKVKFSAGKAPAWVTDTFSGKARLLWLFERPVPTYSPEVFSKFMAILIRDFELRKLLPGLDEGALVDNPHTPYELGTNWRQPFGDARIPHTVVMTALHDASEKAKWKGDVDIPMDAIAAEVTKRWPGRWVGKFEPGARGIRFWDTKADNPTGCTVREQGVQAWTGEHRFIPWGELLGEEFVKSYRASRIGGAIDGTYFDGQSYWRRDETGLWRDLSTEAVKRHLSCIHGLSSETKKGQASEVSQALTTIDQLQRVDGAFPCLFLRDEIVRDGAAKYLNIARAKPMQPSGAPRQWGDGFPWLASYLQGLFGEEQLKVFLSWLSHFYKNAVAGRPKKGHALFLAGPPSAGKTLLSQRVIGAMMGGFQEATSYVLGDTNFNESLFFAPLWAVDDAVASADPRRHVGYSQMVKKIVANPYQEYHAKFKKAVTFKFNGRLIVTLNDDPRSIAMLPQVEGSILDKIVILKAAAPGVSFADVEDTIRQELPAFADFVHGFVLPDWILTRPDEVARVGHNAWHNPDLLSTAKESSQASGLQELLDLWRTYYFRGRDTQEWSGSVTELLMELNDMERVKTLVHNVAPNRIVFGRDLQQLIAQGLDWLGYGRSAKGRVYTIRRPKEEKK